MAENRLQLSLEQYQDQLKNVTDVIQELHTAEEQLDVT